MGRDRQARPLERGKGVAGSWLGGGCGPCRGQPGPKSLVGTQLPHSCGTSGKSLHLSGTQYLHLELGTSIPHFPRGLGTKEQCE